MQDLITPVYLLTGFLGSGKTTLLNKLIEAARQSGKRPAVLLNEVGDVNVEAEYIGADVPMSELLGGCICCSIRGDVGMSLLELANTYKPDVIWIEATGIAEPYEIMDAVTEVSLYDKLALRGVVTVVDAPHFLDRMAIGSGKTFRLMKDQIIAASDIVLSKKDLLRSEDVERVQQQLVAWNPHAQQHVAVRGDIEPSRLYRGDWDYLRDGERGAQVHGGDQEHEHHARAHEHINSFTYYFEHALDSYAFEQFLNTLPDEVYRAKGIVAFKDATSPFLFQYAYRQSDLMRITPQKLVQQVAVFIGEGFSRQELIERLQLLDQG